MFIFIDHVHHKFIVVSMHTELSRIYNDYEMGITHNQCWDSYFLNVTRYMLQIIKTELFSYSYILLI